MSPSGWGNASTWNTHAPLGDVVAGNSNTLEVADVVQNTTEAGGLGHVGFVISVTKDSVGNVTSFDTAELNHLGTGNYSTQTYSTKAADGNFMTGSGSAEWTGIIDVNGTGKGLNGETIGGTATPTTLGAGNLLQVVNTGSGWGSYNLTALDGTKIAGKPGVVWTTNGPDVFGATTDGKLDEFTQCNNNTSWCSYDLTATNAVEGGVSAVINPSNGKIEVFAGSADGSLLQIEGYGSSWTAYNLTAAAGGVHIKGAPGATWTSAGPNIFTIDSNGALRQFTLCSGGGWCTYVIGSNNTFSGGIDAQKTSNAYELFARSTGGHLYQVENTGSSWTTFDMSTAAGGVSIIGTAGAFFNPNANVFVSDTAGRLVQFALCANQTSWCTYQLTGTNAVGNGVQASQQGGSIELFAESKEY